MKLSMEKNAAGWEPAGDIFGKNCRFYKPMRLGIVTKSFRVYTENERNAIEKANQIIEESNNNFFRYQDDETNKQIDDWCEKNGFNSQRVTYCILGNTYVIKDKLKEAGCRYHEKLGWHCYEPLSLPSIYRIEPVLFDDAFVWDQEKSKALPRESVKRLEGLGIQTEWAGDIGDTLKDLEVTLIRTTIVNNKYGRGFIYTFCTDKYVLVWSTKTVLEFKEGQSVILTKAKIKNLDTYNDIKQTIIKNATIDLLKPMV